MLRVLNFVFVLLFAIFFCVYAAPTTDDSKIALSKVYPKDVIVLSNKEKDDDLNVDASSDWRYYNGQPYSNYYIPRWNQYWNSGWDGQGNEWSGRGSGWRYNWGLRYWY